MTDTELLEKCRERLAKVWFEWEGNFGNQEPDPYPTWESLKADPRQESCVAAWLARVDRFMPTIAEFVRERQRERDKEWRAAFGAEDLVPGDDPVKIAKWVEGSYTHHDEEIQREARLEALEQALRAAKRGFQSKSKRPKHIQVYERIRALSGPAEAELK